FCFPAKLASRIQSKPPALQSRIAIPSGNCSPRAQQDTYVTAMAYVPVAMTAYAAMKVGGWDLAGLVKDPSGDAFRQLLKSIEDELVQFERSRKDPSQDRPDPTLQPS